MKVTERHACEVFGPEILRDEKVERNEKVVKTNIHSDLAKRL